MTLSHDEILRYQRQIILDEVHIKGQMKLKKAKVLVIGSGGLGSPVLTYLAIAGVGNIGIVEFDRISRSNLNRQTLYTEETINKFKINEASARLSELNSNAVIDIYNEYLTPDLADSLFKNYDLIIDCTDNFASRYLINDLAVYHKRTVIFASILRHQGQLTVYNYQDGPCYRCLYPEAPASLDTLSCSEAGILGTVAGSLGVMQANEAIKFILGYGELMSGKLLNIDMFKMQFNHFKYTKNKNCDICSDRNLDVEKIKNSLSSEFCGYDDSELSAKTFYDIINSEHDFDCYDLSTAKDFSHEILDEFEPLNYYRLQAGKMFFSKSKKYLFICQSGNLSKKIVSEYKTKGYENFYHLKGGILSLIDFIEKK